MNKAIVLSAVLAALAAAEPRAWAQVQDKPFIEEERRREMDERKRSEEDLKQPFLWDAGGWVHSEFIQLDDRPDRTDRTMRFFDTRLWGEARYERRFMAYVRLQSAYTDFNAGDQFEGADDNTFDICRVDQAYLEGDFTESGRGVTVRAGKQFLSLGRGLLWSGVAYGGLATWSSGRFQVRGMGGHTDVIEDDFDKSLPSSDTSERAFGGAEEGYTISPKHRVYALQFIERDRNDETSSTQDWGYDATYWGIGARGALWGGLGYGFEGIYENGTTPGAGGLDDDPIRAWAFLATLDYRVDLPTEPAFMVEYMYGSGDSDRDSVTDTATGNEADTTDKGFLSFGFVQTGFALFPRVSNIHIIRVGGSFRPLEKIEVLRNMEIGVYGYSYRKDKKEAPISDPRSYLEDDDIGNEVDAFLHWRIVSDVGLSINYGRFMPGDAYDEQQDRDFVSAGVTYSF